MNLIFRGEKEYLIIIFIQVRKKIRFYNAYIPPGSSNGWIKIETLEGIFEGLNTTSSDPSDFMWRF